MAKNSLKSTLQLDLDPSGVVKGVAATNRELQKLNRSAGRTAVATSITAGLDVLQMGIRGIQMAAQAIENRMQGFAVLANKYSPEAMGAAMTAQMARFEADRRIGAALAPGAIQRSQAEEDIAAGEAARVERNAAAINESMGASKRFYENFMSSLSMLAEVGGGLIGAAEAAVGGDFAGAGTLYSGARSMAGELFESSNFAYRREEPGRGMGGSLIERQTKALESIDRKMGGN
jgi:hypothetical protein